MSVFYVLLSTAVARQRLFYSGIVPLESCQDFNYCQWDALWFS
jgi:hypothetical protein